MGVSFEIEECNISNCEFGNNLQFSGMLGYSTLVQSLGFRNSDLFEPLVGCGGIYASLDEVLPYQA